MREEGLVSGIFIFYIWVTVPYYIIINFRLRIDFWFLFLRICKSFTALMVQNKSYEGLIMVLESI